MAERDGELDLPPDWRERMIAMIRGAEPLDGAWFTGGPVCSPLDQIGIYHNQYRLRLYDALRDELIGLRYLLDQAEDGVGEALLRKFLFEHPSGTYTLNRIADGLADWLATQPNVPTVWVEMARLDWAVQHGFEAAAGPPLDPAAIAAAFGGQGPRLVLQPHVHLVRCTHNVHEVRGAVLGGGAVPALRAGGFPLVVFRRGLHMRHWCVPLGLWGILSGLDQGQTLSEAVEGVFARGWATVDQLAADIGGWFRDLAERDIVTTVLTPSPSGRGTG